MKCRNGMPIAGYNGPSRRRALWILTAAFVLCALGANARPVHAGIIEYGTTAETTDFMVDDDGLPISATTTFFKPLWEMGDPIRTAHHELLHAIGFTIAYALFADHVQPEMGGIREFTENTNGMGTVLGKLLPAAQGTHVDPTAGMVNGFDQADSVMGPSNVDGQRMSDFEKAMLDAAFGWSSENLKINVVFMPPDGMDENQMMWVNDAVDSAHTLFGGDQSGHKFTWTVKHEMIPGPGGLVILVMGGLISRRRRRSN